MIYINRYNVEEEWEHYLQDYREYLKTVCSLEELSQILPEIESIEYKKRILCLQNRKQNPFVICKIMKQKIQIGFCDYICYADEDGKCLIGNFFVYAEHRNKGYGSAAYEQIERELKQQNGKYIEITPAKDAILFYLRKGFHKTTQKSLENGEIVYRKQI